jgi:integrase
MRYHLDTYLLPRWGKDAVEFITAEKVNDWIGELGHLSPDTVRGVVATLQRALGVKFGKGKIHYPARLKATEDTRCFTSGEVTAMLAGATGQYRALFTLAAETGMRAGELYGLQVEDIEFSRNVIHVRRSAWNGKLQSPKTQNSRRAIDVQPYVTELLRQHLAGRTSGLVFLSRIRTALRNTTVLHKHLHPLLKKLNLEIGGMHAFRHFRVSFLVQNDTPVEIIKRWIGHGSEQMIRRYTHLHPTYFKGVMARIPTVIAPSLPHESACVIQ